MEFLIKHVSKCGLGWITILIGEYFPSWIRLVLAPVICISLIIKSKWKVVSSYIVFCVGSSPGITRLMF